MKYLLVNFFLLLEKHLLLTHYLIFPVPKSTEQTFITKENFLKQYVSTKLDTQNKGLIEE